MPLAVWVLIERGNSREGSALCAELEPPEPGRPGAAARCVSEGRKEKRSKEPIRKRPEPIIHLPHPPRTRATSQPCHLTPAIRRRPTRAQQEIRKDKASRRVGRQMDARWDPAAGCPDYSPMGHLLPLEPPNTYNRSPQTGTSAVAAVAAAGGREK